MRITALLVLMLCVLSSGLAAKKSDGLHLSVSQTRGTINASVKLDNYSLDESVLIEGEAFSKLLVDGAVYTAVEGAPELPFKQYNFQLSANSDVQVKVVSSEYKEIVLNAPILPARRTIYRNENPKAVPYEKGNNYTTDAFFPQKQVALLDPYLLRDARGVTLQVYPVQYNPVTNIVRIYTTLDIEITQVESNSAINAAPIVKSRTLSPQMDNLYSNLFVNYKRWDNAVSEEGDMLVIYTARDKETIKKYIDHKKSYSKYVKNITSTEVATGTNVKQTIKDAYAANANLLYVQLVGDWPDIKSDLGGGASAPMDPVLGCVSGSDNYPDIIIGRFSCKDAATLTPQIDKAIAYESNGVQPWMFKGMGIASDEGAGMGDDNEADFEHMDIIKENKLIPNEFTNVEECYKSVSATTVGNNIQDGLGLINYVGHGSHSAWSTSGFSTSNISSLVNDATPVIISVACINGEFHNGANCFAEGWLRQKDGGAVATVMATINQPWTPPMRGQDYMNDLITGGYDYSSNPGSGTSTSEARHTFGSVVFNGLVLMYAEQSGSADLNTIQTWTIFGDCALDLRPTQQGTDGPTDLALSGTDVDENDTAAVIGTVSVTNSNSAVTHSFTLSDDRFVIDGDELALAADEVLNFEDEESVSLTITVTDSDNNSYSEDFTIVVNDINDAPVVSTIDDQTVQEGNSFQGITLSNHVADEDHTDDEITWTTTTSSYIKVVIGTSAAYITVNDNQWTGSEKITFTATDPEGASDETEVTFTVEAVNDAPVVSTIPNQKIAEGGSFTGIKLNNYVADPDNSDDEITWVATTSGSYLTVVTTTSGAYVTVTDENWNGTEKVTFTATDPGGLSDQTTVSFTVTPVNDAPTIENPVFDVDMENNSSFVVFVETVFDDVDNEDLVLTIKREEDEELPEWMNFDGVAITMDPDKDVLDTFDLYLTASDGEYEVTDTFEVLVKEGVAIIEVDEKVNAANELLFAPNPVPAMAEEVSFVTPANLNGEWSVAIYDNVNNLLDEATFYSEGGKRYSWDIRNKSGNRVAAAFYVAVIRFTDKKGRVREFKKKIGVRQ